MHVSYGSNKRGSTVLSKIFQHILEHYFLTNLCFSSSNPVSGLDMGTANFREKESYGQ